MFLEGLNYFRLIFDILYTYSHTEIIFQELLVSFSFVSAKAYNSLNYPLLSSLTALCIISSVHLMIYFVIYSNQS